MTIMVPVALATFVLGELTGLAGGRNDNGNYENEVFMMSSGTLAAVGALVTFGMWLARFFQ